MPPMRRGRRPAAVAALALALACMWWPAAAPAAGRCGDHPWCDRSLSADARTALLLPQLTLDEKLDLMGGDDPDGFLHADANSATVNGVPRLGVPPLHLNDGPGGIRLGIGADSAPATALPSPLALAAAFDPKLADAYAGVIAAEAKRRGADVVLGPMVNLVRDPRAGRNFESYGEDPRLLSDLGVAFIRGLQRRGVIADVKHFAANNQETDRFTIDERIDERTLREIYLPQFEAAVRRAHVGTVMTAYNRVNGAFMGANQPLVRRTLLRDFGFKGLVLSDFAAGGDTVGSALAGQSLALPGPLYYEPSRLRAALAAGTLTQATVDDLVRRYLRTLFRFGVFDRAARPFAAPLPAHRHARVARTVAGRGVVLLRNRRSLLPLSPRRLRSVAVIGESAAEVQRPNAISSGGVKPLLTVTLRQAIDRVGLGRHPFRVRYSDGADIGDAARLARRTRVAVVAVAPSAESGEFDDRDCLALDCPPAAAHQDALVRAVARANPRTVVVVQSPGPVLMPWAGRVPAILEAWWPGETGGAGIADVLFGRVNPSARLPVTFPRRDADVPARTPLQFPGVGGRAVYSEGVLVGYRWYDQRRIRPLFPFGFGLSYTSFHYRDLDVRDLSNAHTAGKVRVKLRVANVGPRRGAEVVQLYVGLPRAAKGVVQPPKALKRFRRVEIPSGRSRDVTFSLEDRDFSYWDAKRNAWRVGAGCYRILVGSSSRDIRLEEVIARGSAGCARPAGA